MNTSSSDQPRKAIPAPVGSKAFRDPDHAFKRIDANQRVQIQVPLPPDIEERNRLGHIIRRNFDGRTKVSIAAIVVCVLSFLSFGYTLFTGAFWLALSAFLVFCFTPTGGYACSQCMQRIHPQARRCPHCHAVLDHRSHRPTTAG